MYSHDNKEPVAGCNQTFSCFSWLRSVTRPRHVCNVL